MRQEFVCERCGVESHIYLDSDESVYVSCEKIRKEHEKWSPECTGDLSTIKLLNQPAWVQKEMKSEVA